MDASFTSPADAMESFPSNASDQNDTQTTYSNDVRSVFMRNVQNVVEKNSFYGEEFTTSYDLSSPREWMEYLGALDKEESRGRDVSVEFVGGDRCPYTVMRCEVMSNSSGPSTDLINLNLSWQIFGKEYHMARMLQSMTSHLNLHVSERIVEDSEQIIASLLKNAEDFILGQLFEKSAHSDSSKNTERRYVFMLTLLWTPKFAFANSKNKDVGILVRGHLKYIQTTSLFEMMKSPSPITATLGIPCTPEGYTQDYIIDNQNNLPKRYDNLPLVKCSSWCRERRPLEDDKYKTNGRCEVLLLRNLRKEPMREESISQSNVGQSQTFTNFNGEILEGLTSNFFAIFQNGQIRTASDGVLHGFVRKLVLESVEECGLTFNPEPIYLSDLKYCDEAFITSSIRLMVPIQKIYMPYMKSKKVKPLGQKEVIQESEPNPHFGRQEVWASKTKNKFDELLNSLLRKHR